MNKQFKFDTKAPLHNFISTTGGSRYVEIWRECNRCISQPGSLRLSGKPAAAANLSAGAIARHILLIRDQKVLLDTDLAELYGVTTSSLVQAVKRNADRFPDDFMFQLNAVEWSVLRSQTVISNSRRGGRRYAPYAFSEQGVAMLSSVLSSVQAIAVNIEIVRAFVRLREVIVSNKELALRLDELESKADLMAVQHDTFAHTTRVQLRQVFEAIRELMATPEPAKKQAIGFVAPEEKPARPKARVSNDAGNP